MKPIPYLLLLNFLCLSCGKGDNDNPTPQRQEQRCDILTNAPTIPIVGPNLKNDNSFWLDTLIESEDGTWQPSPGHLIGTAGKDCFKVSDKRVLIRDTRQSLAQIIEPNSDAKEIVLDKVFLPPLTDICPRFSFSQHGQSTLRFEKIHHIDPRYESLQQFDIEIKHKGIQIYAWSKLTAKDLETLLLPAELEFKSGSYQVFVKESNYLLDHFETGKACEIELKEHSQDFQLDGTGTDSRFLGGQRVEFFESGHSIKFESLNSVGDFKTEFCIKELTYGELREPSIQESCSVSELKEAQQLGPLLGGFYKVTHRAKQGNFYSEWKTQKLAIRSSCILRNNQLESVNKELNYCTDYLNDLTTRIPRLHDRYHTISSIKGDVVLDSFIKNNTLQDVNHVFGNLKLSTDSKTITKYLGNLSTVGGNIEIVTYGNYRISFDRLSHAKDIDIKGNPGFIDAPNLKTALRLDFREADGFSAENLQSIKSLWIYIRSHDTIPHFDSIQLPSLIYIDRLNLTGLAIKKFPDLPQIRSIGSIVLEKTQISSFGSKRLDYVGYIRIAHPIDFDEDSENDPGKVFDFSSLPKVIDRSLYLSGLSQITDFAFLKDVRLGDQFGLSLFDLKDLRSLKGLEGRTHLSNFYTSLNPNLSDISALNDLRSIGYAWIRDLEVEGKIFEKLQSADEFDIRDMPNISGFDELKHLGSFNISMAHEQLIDGFSALTSAGSISITTKDSDGDADLTFSAFKNLKEIRGDFVFDITNDALQPLFNQIEVINGKSFVRVPGACIPYDQAPLFQNLAQGKTEKTNSYLRYMHWVLFHVDEDFDDYPYEDLPTNTYYTGDKDTAKKVTERCSP